MKLVYDGKTKQIYRENQHLVLQFKNTLTGDSSGSIDPGGNQTVGKKDGKGKASAQTAAHFFKLIESSRIPTHFLKVRSPVEIEVQATDRVPLEVIYRALAYGSFLSRYGNNVEKFQELDLVEFSLKNDELGDPFIAKGAIPSLNLADGEEVEKMEEITREVASIINRNLSERDLRLVDMKVEFGKFQGKLIVIDEISGDTMRVYDPRENKILNQIELARRLGLT